MSRTSARPRPAARIAALAAVGTIAIAHVGRAQETARNASLFLRTVPAPNRALELGLAAGYDQGVGALGGALEPHVQDVAGVGAGLNVSVGYRASPRLSFAAFGQGGLYTDVVPDTGAKSAAAGVRAAWHFRPYRSIDPWISLGAGYRVFWSSLPGESATVRQALQAVQLGLGVDYRMSPEFGVGPFIAGDLSYFFRETPPGRPSTSVSALSSFVSAGISARFDLLGQALHPASDLALAPPW
jgi:hypothetical protein